MADGYLHDNTAAKGLRLELEQDFNKLDERSSRLVSYVRDQVGELILETREGMSNRVDDGFSAAEARKYGSEVVKIIEAVHIGLAQIERNFLRDMDGIIGPGAYSINDDGTVDFVLSGLGGKLATGSLGVEQHQLEIVKLADAAAFDQGDGTPAGSASSTPTA